jgi:hypothetical protein
MEGHEQAFKKIFLGAALAASASSITVIAVGSSDARWGVAAYFMVVAMFCYLLAKLQ